MTPVDPARAPDEANQAQAAPRPPEPFPVVVVGGATGSLEALVDILDALTADVGMAFVYLHAPAPAADPARTLAGHTPMPIVVVDEPTDIAPDHLYLLSGDRRWALTERTLATAADERDPRHHPFDLLLETVAAAVEQCAIGVVLSGGEPDGALGLREIKAVGGITVAQDPETAAEQAAPRAAIATGVVDLVLAPAHIAAELLRIGRTPYVRRVALRRGADGFAVQQEQLHRIFAMLRTASGVDFTHYKPPTIRRRLQRRMVLHKLDTVEQYIKLLRDDPEEVGKLYQDLLIHVTRFFRDPESFKALATIVFPQILEDRRGINPIRIWLPGCSTGEEAYSVAITLLESLGDEASAVPIQIFATDVSETAIEHARNGVYPESVAVDLSPERLRRFFTRTEGHYRIAKVVRDLCVFARQDVTRDPPFSKLDLILCRNVLIYLGAVLQRKLMTVFHYALKPSGFLMLGGAETVGAQADLFAVVDKKHRLFVKKLIDTPGVHIPVEYAAPGRAPPRPRAPEHHPGQTFQSEANRVVLDRYGPPGVIVDDDLQIVQFRGRTGLYLEPAPGDVTQSLNLLKMAREGLLHGLQSALFAARKTDKPLRKDGLRVVHDGGSRAVDLIVTPLVVPGEPRHYLVLFEDRAQEAQEPARALAPLTAGDDERLRQLQDELAASREYLQSIIQDLEAANEELQSANEEILSSNEELQSTNEELDTAKEELQSTNEELNTVNEELHGRNDELSRVNSDLVNLLGCVEIAIVIVGADLGIRRFTPMAEKVLNLIPSDIGRPISQIKPNIECPELEKLIARVIDTVTIHEVTVRDGEGRWYSLRIRPYKNVENRIDGAVLALFDVSSRRHESELRHARDEVRAVLDVVHTPVLVLDAQRRVQSVSRAFARMFDLPGDAPLQRLVYDLHGGPWGGPDLRRLLEDVLPRAGRVEGHRVDAEFPAVGFKSLRIDACRIDGGEHGVAAIVLAFVDRTEPARHGPA